MSQPRALRGALDQPGNIGQHDVLPVLPDDAQIRRQRGEMIVPDLRLRAGQDGKDGALSHIGIAHQPDIRDGFQLEAERPDLRFDARFGKVGRLARRSREVPVSPPAAAALQTRPGFPGPVHVRHDPAGFIVPDHRAHRHLDDQVLPPLSGPQVAHPVPAVLRRILAAETEIQQGVHILIGVQQHIAAPAAVPAVGSAVLDIFFPVKGSGAVSAVPGLGRDFHPIHKIAHALSVFPRPEDLPRPASFRLRVPLFLFRSFPVRTPANRAGNPCAVSVPQ